MLSTDKIKNLLSPQYQGELITLESVDSTNTFLLNYIKMGCSQGTAVLAETQTAGRCRNTDSLWISPPGHNICMSLFWQFPKNIALEALSLAIGVVISKVLSEFGAKNIGLKWPNDIYLNGDKIGGILIETQVNKNYINIVIGIGLNIFLSEVQRKAIPKKTTDLSTSIGKKIDRNILSAALINQLIFDLKKFEEQGFPAFTNGWEALNIFHEKNVIFKDKETRISHLGIMQGIDEHGKVILRSQGIVQTFYNGSLVLDEGDDEQ